MVDYFELLYWLCHGLALWYLNIASCHEHHQLHRFRWLSVDGMHSKVQSNSLTIKLTFSSFCSDPFPEKKVRPVTAEFPWALAGRSQETGTFAKEIKFQIDVALREACAAASWESR
jgi:hypothetical protein